MTLEQLRIFVAVAETLNMREAAETLHITQPAVSAAIAALEERHDTKLFDRIGRGLALNEAGRTLLPEARDVLARAGEALRVFDDLSGLARGELRIAASQTVATYWLPRRLARFAARHPGITLRFDIDNTLQTAAAVLAGEADLGFVEGKVDEAGLSIRKIGGDQLKLYASPGHPLTGRTLKRKDLLGASWVLREEGSGTRSHFEKVLLDRFSLKLADLDIRLALPSNGAVMEVVAEGDLVTAVSDLATVPRVKAGFLQALDCVLGGRDFNLLQHRARRPPRAAQAFIAMM